MYSLEQMKNPNFKKQFTNEQWDLVKNYFAVSQGCGKKPMTHEEYLKRVKDKVEKLDLYNKALNKIGLDESELKEIPPIKVVGFVFNNPLAVTGQQNKYTNLFETTYILFSSTQVYIYTYVLDMLSASNKERSDEYFYKDIVNITTLDESREFTSFKVGCIGAATPQKETKQFSQLQIVVPGDKLYCAIDPESNPDLETQLKAAKAKIREKKM